jgi:hypothetical protein
MGRPKKFFKISKGYYAWAFSVFPPWGRPSVDSGPLERMDATGQALHVDAKALKIDIKSIARPTRAPTGARRRIRAPYAFPGFLAPLPFFHPSVNR